VRIARAVEAAAVAATGTPAFAGGLYVRNASAYRWRGLIVETL